MILPLIILNNIEGLNIKFEQDNIPIKLNMKKISIILPCLNESKNLPILLPEIIKNIPKKYNFEIICVDDGSTDETEIILERIVKRNKKIKGIIFHSQFGHQAALLAGIKNTSGDAIITMDADFQHPPSLLPKFIKFWEKGHDLVSGQKREDRSASFLTKLEREVGYFIWAKINDKVLIPGISDFRLFSRKIADYINSSQESDVFLRGVVGLVAKNHKIIPYSVVRRKYGKSSYSSTILFSMFLRGAVSFSPKPLRIASVLGLLMALFTTSFIIFSLLVAAISGRRIIEGFVTIALLILVLNGFIIFYLGVIGEYLGIVFREVKKRPAYLIERTINL